MNAKIVSVFWLVLFDVCSMSRGLQEQVQKSELSKNEQNNSTINNHPAGGNNEGRHKMVSHDSTDTVFRNLLHGYDKRETPTKDQPTEVRIGIYILHFHSINEQAMDFSLSMYLRQSWRDPRLSFEPIDGNISSILLHDDGWQDLWCPDTFMRNEKRSSFHDVMKPNRMMKLNSTGHVWYVTKVSATFSCPMRLQKYPMDTQYCSIYFESFTYTTEKMYFAWLGSPVDIDPSNELPQHTTVDIILYDCTQNYSSGNYSCLEIRFGIKRNIGYYMMQVYLPSGLIVVLSWMTFWIKIDKVAERVSVGLVLILTMTTWNAGIQSSLPRVSYIKGVHQVCFVFCVFIFSLQLVTMTATNSKNVDYWVYVIKCHEMSFNLTW